MGDALGESGRTDQGDSRRGASPSAERGICAESPAGGMPECAEELAGAGRVFCAGEIAGAVAIVQQG